MTVKPLRLLIVGAHPDDAEFHAGGLAALYGRAGHVVKMLSVTDGGAGHQHLAPHHLVAIRRREAAASAAVIGAKSEVWYFPDGELQPTIELRRLLIGEIRTFAPDLLVTHRPNDYHPDHRAVGQAVQDASYMVTVPKVVPDIPFLPRDPVVAYMVDLFTKPYAIVPDVLLDVTDQLETIVAMLACHGSQVFEWLPFNQGVLERVPEGKQERIDWARRMYVDYARPRADRYRRQLVAAHGARGKEMECVEVYEFSEYAAGVDDLLRRRLFWFLAEG